MKLRLEIEFYLSTLLIAISTQDKKTSSSILRATSCLMLGQNLSEILSKVCLSLMRLKKKVLIFQTKDQCSNSKVRIKIIIRKIS